MKQTIRVEIDLGEMYDSQAWEVLRRDVQWDGAPGVFDGFGVMSLRLNDTPVLAVQVHEDKQGRVVVEVQQIRDSRPSGMPTVIEVEREGLVPPRPEGSESKRMKWGG